MNELLVHNVEEKLRAEAKSFDPSKPETLLQESVIKALVDFSRQQNDLAKAIMDSKSKLYDCCKEIVKDTEKTRCISDVEAYTRAVKFYLPDAEVNCTMTVTVPGRKNGMVFSLLDFME